MSEKVMLRVQSCATLRPHGLQPTRLLYPWNSPGKNTGVGCHFLLQCMKVKSESEVAQSCPTLSNPWTAAHQAPPSMGFSKQEYWSGVPLPSLQRALRSVKNWLFLTGILLTPLNMPGELKFRNWSFWNSIRLKVVSSILDNSCPKFSLSELISFKILVYILFLPFGKCISKGCWYFITKKG